jgi:putative DNA primase/helicase
MWARFLHEATAGDAKLQAWLQRLFGYALTGDVTEEMLAFVYGPGGNGKGVFLRTLSVILGEYAYQAPTELFKAESRINREYQVAKLDGIRLIFASETEAGSVLAESFVKELTGNEGKLNGRNPYGRPFEFRSQAKLVIVGNYAPKLRGRSEAMERRLRVVPFNHKPANPDPGLKDKLVTEYPAILRWAIDGCLMWQRERLGVCPAVVNASAAYFEEQDAVAQWAAERCDIDAGAKALASDLLEDFNGWLKARGEKQVDAKMFKELAMQLPGVEWKRDSTGRTQVRGLAKRQRGADEFADFGAASAPASTTP